MIRNDFIHKYKFGIGFILTIFVLGFIGFSLASAQQPLQINISLPQQETKIQSPTITVFPPSLNNKEILYLGGTTEPGYTVLVFLQRGKEALITAQVQADESGSWFYAHKGFLAEGKYSFWVRARTQEGILSEPTQSAELNVLGEALEIGSYRIGFKSLYVFAVGALSIIVTIFIIVILIIHIRIQSKKRRLQKEVLEVHSSVKKGFEILKDDIHKELDVLRELEKNKQLSPEEKARQAKLLTDLDFAARYIEKEVIDVEKLI
ncbi:hypothetical protein C4553_00035 [Candidatus Parcubacteria bacterium]|nr:MAG: hypothetical protein C4553_00035 [Candidatus Parcubacteria bacterium]